MRRILLLVAGLLALALAVPGAASAHGHHHRHHHKVKAHHTRLKHFGAAANTSPSTPSAPGDAGRVASFTGGVLTITLADGSTVSGKVTNDTEINCVPAVQTPTPTAGTARDGGGSGDQGDQGDDQGDQSGGDHHGRCHGQSACTVADLVPGAVVHEAILKIGANGAEFKLVLLVKQQPAAS